MLIILIVEEINVDTKKLVPSIHMVDELKRYISSLNQITNMQWSILPWMRKLSNTNIIPAHQAQCKWCWCYSVHTHFAGILLVTEQQQNECHIQAFPKCSINSAIRYWEIWILYRKPLHFKRLFDHLADKRNNSATAFKAVCEMEIL